MVNQEVKTWPLSESVLGRPIIIASSLAASATPIHQMTSTDDVMDAMFIRVNNDTIGNIVVRVVIMSADDTATSESEDAALVFTVPRLGSVVVMDGERIRFDAGNANYHVGMYTTGTAATAESLRVTGWFNRITQADLTP